MASGFAGGLDFDGNRVIFFQKSFFAQKIPFKKTLTIKPFTVFMRKSLIIIVGSLKYWLRRRLPFPQKRIPNNVTFLPQKV